MDPALRTRRLADSLKDVAFAFSFSMFFSRTPFASVVVCSYLAMGLADLARWTEVSGRWPLRCAAALAATAGVLTTVDVWVDGQWLVAGYLLSAGVGLLLGVVGYSGIAAWFGGGARWQRARVAGVAIACASCFAAGMLLQTSPTASGIGSLQLPNGVAGGVAGAVALASIIVIAVAGSDLRDRVKAAIVQYDADAALPAHPEQLRG
ncbi:MAG: hypothetical protein ABMA25_04770 [Ilumatobacteraceae bacterium]